MIYSRKDFLSKKQKGREGENSALVSLEEQGWKLLKRNYTIRGGEIDLLMQNEEYITCFEVKNIYFANDIHDFISQRKIRLLKRTFEVYLHRYPSILQPRIDVIFVKQGKVWKHYEQITLL